jgi:hypothetical protein
MDTVNGLPWVWLLKNTGHSSQLETGQKKMADILSPSTKRSHNMLIQWIRVFRVQLNVYNT